MEVSQRSKVSPRKWLLETGSNLELVVSQRNPAASLHTCTRGPAREPDAALGKQRLSACHPVMALAVQVRD